MSDILTGVAEIVREITGIKLDQITPDASFVNDLDIDSLSMVEIAVAAEERFEVRIPDDAVPNFKTVADAVAYIELQLTGASA